jgi:hypothetical protein
LTQVGAVDWVVRGERGFALLKDGGKCYDTSRARPTEIGAIARGALVLTHSSPIAAATLIEIISLAGSRQTGAPCMSCCACGAEFVEATQGFGGVMEELGAVHGGDERGGGLEDADAGGAFDVLPVAHQNGLTDAERGCGRALGVKPRHLQDLADVGDAARAGAGGDNGCG